MAQIIDGKSIAAKARSEVKAEVLKFISTGGPRPKLAVVLAGDDPASQVYVRNKERGCAEVGMASEVRRLPASTRQRDLIDIVRQLNADKGVHGILVQLPLPTGLNEREALDEVDPRKDVDGLHPLNMGKLLKGDDSGFVPCTPQGVIEIILSTGIDLAGKAAVVVGRSNLVGKPMALLLLQNNATVTICHSRTVNLGEVTKRADILVAAVGSPRIIHGEMIKQGAVVVDVGTNRVGDKLVGDVDFDSAEERAAFITPVPGGVGPMTIALLLRNTLKAAALLAAKKA
ncbi:bifunctional 5,10-methylene-tetrahydrofolate dehydrogenase/5,10-methylene-tetrahydrofolate cyclohydrolase [candidate division WOR-1 bacterium RIFCSPHIGHO2_01_FULL_53_15]|uniref:Bifunctional protein FolD n=1 Tax=candidate division WOR-1 bacterium RIFCSPHIGHO2_01_FULL_53_15 TaxID=1802564 RepID=A0A1F4PZC3_UNCSA|nr:MAG: bifunctional 5,10-methylene-tetrahydrofolate dehydrogenase/5,10-methylene-tetrahydrofolate cyclohydrolase [candidate division WOR-1 bacterium RIFCSPHIGHO2_01_FULL_53_15]OGC10617.1 MAG: bifunctional 5,10-methylene-tetrahydrofolate dehydrogenase/5,10-methylene-tetrahydrofolate cyclohydrolase [candidate division WOR-1 bacterium RIFCSPHIGHO2_02_FULL_53_26]